MSAGGWRRGEMSGFTMKVLDGRVGYNVYFLGVYGR